MLSRTTNGSKSKGSCAGLGDVSCNYIFIFFLVFFLIYWSTIFLSTRVRSISTLLILVVRRTLSTYKSNLVRRRNSLSFCSRIVGKNRARKSSAVSREARVFCPSWSKTRFLSFSHNVLFGASFSVSFH